MFSRNLNPDFIRTANEATDNGGGNEAVDRRALHERIAGTTTTASHKLKDTVLGYQAMVGVDHGGRQHFHRSQGTLDQVRQDLGAFGVTLVMKDAF